MIYFNYYFKSLWFFFWQLNYISTLKCPIIAIWLLLYLKRITESRVKNSVFPQLIRTQQQAWLASLWQLLGAGYTHVFAAWVCGLYGGNLALAAVEDLHMEIHKYYKSTLFLSGKIWYLNPRLPLLSLKSMLRNRQTLNQQKLYIFTYRK